MKFCEQLYVAVLKGTVEYKKGGLYISPKLDMRSIFPNCRVTSYSSVRKNMKRAGYMYCKKNATWYTKAHYNNVQAVARRVSLCSSD